ncbi:MAG: hypothetical protein LAO04_12925 [Acidobacteriia bacterium]|nr:hypothetical protein [Terriglobia bacterium]
MLRPLASGERRQKPPGTGKQDQSQPIGITRFPICGIEDSAENEPMKLALLCGAYGILAGDAREKGLPHLDFRGRGGLGETAQSGLGIRSPNRQVVLISCGRKAFALELRLTEVKVGNEIARTLKGWFKRTATDSTLLR